MKWFADLFKRQPAEEEGPSIDSIRFDTLAWTLRERDEDKMFWVNEDGDALSFALIREPDCLPPLSDVDTLRDYARGIAVSDGKVGGIISVDVVEMQGLPALTFIYKYERLPAYGYTGMVVFPFSQFSYVAAVSSVERGVTGRRDAYVAGRMAQRGELEIEEFEEPDSDGSVGRVKGWFEDPYDPGYEGHILRNVADDEKYDSLFPEHPLTKVRKLLEQMHRSLSYDEEIIHVSR